MTPTNIGTELTIALKITTWLYEELSCIHRLMIEGQSQKARHKLIETLEQMNAFIKESEQYP